MYIDRHIHSQGTLPPLFLAVEEYVRACEENKLMGDIARRKELVEFLLEQPGIRLDASNKVLQLYCN